MTATNMFHVGILVPDLEAAVPRFAEVLGMTFLPSAVAHVDYLEEHGDTHPIDLRITWSMQGPPYVELLEMTGDGLYGSHHGEGLHHIGFWEPDCEGLRSRFAALGLVTEGTQYTPERGIIATYVSPDGFHGTRLEYVDEGRRPGMESWLAGEAWTN